jgi:periplasmic divalent cation tolerance protein
VLFKQVDLMSDYSITLTTCANESEAEQIASSLVEANFAACVNLLPQVRSIYKWQDKICNETEVLLVIKSSKKNQQVVEELITQLHSYEVPEIIHIAIDSGSKKYMNWLSQEII